MSKTNSRYRKIARECYDRVLDETGGRCNVEDIADEVREEIRAQEVGDDILDDFVEGLVKAEDDRRASRADSGQLDLLTGDEEALDAVWRTGGGNRVQVRHATRVDGYARLGIRAENVAHVNAAFAKDQQQFAQLIPYLTDDTITITQARAAWRKNNPGAEG